MDYYLEGDQSTPREIAEDLSENLHGLAVRLYIDEDGDFMAVSTSRTRQDVPWEWDNTPGQTVYYPSGQEVEPWWIEELATDLVAELRGED